MNYQGAGSWKEVKSVSNPIPPSNPETITASASASTSSLKPLAGSELESKKRDKEDEDGDGAEGAGGDGGDMGMWWFHWLSIHNE